MRVSEQRAFEGLIYARAGKLDLARKAFALIRDGELVDADRGVAQSMKAVDDGRLACRLHAPLDRRRGSLDGDVAEMRHAMAGP